MAPNYFVFFLIFFVPACWSYGDNIGVKGRPPQQQGVKSYGGYIPDQGQRSNEQVHSDRYHQQIQQQQPNYYQPYGWNYNQPSRTYGKVIRSINETEKVHE
jgi:hypothetical protein